VDEALPEDVGRVDEALPEDIACEEEALPEDAACVDDGLPDFEELGLVPEENLLLDPFGCDA